jgi:hypothetical protein
MAGPGRATAGETAQDQAGPGPADEGRAAGRRERARQRRRAAEQEYRDEVYRQWLAAEAATNGFMLNRAGQRLGIDERTLFPARSPGCSSTPQRS